MEERMPVFEYNSSKAGIMGNENVEVKTSQIQPMTKGVLKKHPTLVAAGTFSMLVSTSGRPVARSLLEHVSQIV